MYGRCIHGGGKNGALFNGEPFKKEVPFEAGEGSRGSAWEREQHLFQGGKSRGGGRKDASAIAQRKGKNHLAEATLRGDT